MSYTCQKCNNPIYIGSQLSVDSYFEKDSSTYDNDSYKYEHHKCPPYLYKLQCNNYQCRNYHFFSHDPSQKFCDWQCEKASQEDD